MRIDLSGRRALVTGSTAGIGEAIAAGLARAGAEVVVNGRTRERVDTAVDRVASSADADGRVRGVAADLGTAEGCDALIEAAPEHDVLVNSAGAFHYGMTKTAQLAVARGMAESVPGSGVTINSVLPGPTLSEGVGAMLTEVAEPGESVEEAGRRFIASDRPTSLLGRPTDPEEVASMVVYVASPEASATTGAALRVDGGVVRAIP